MLSVALLALALLSPGSCHPRGDLPDPACTPGAVATTDVAVVCGTSTRTRRHVTAGTRHEVLAAYGVRDARGWELDHLVPLELGGANSAANLWPEPPPGFHDKDKAENLLHARVCSGAMSLAEAQKAFQTDWTAIR